jgi:hypothetical protein
MSRTQTGTFFNEQWYLDNAQDIARAREQTAKARAELARMNEEQFSAAMADAVLEALGILTREN